MFKPKAKSYPLVSGVDAAKSSDDKYLARYINLIMLNIYYMLSN